MYLQRFLEIAGVEEETGQRGGAVAVKGGGAACVTLSKLYFSHVVVVVKLVFPICSLDLRSLVVLQ